MNEIEKKVFESAQKDSMKYLKVASAQLMHSNYYALYDDEGSYVGYVSFLNGKIHAFYAN